ncbi:MAG: hypothetical protein GX444_01660 [Myxococcales bacterium]|nr:hypothetical protein [Myxococcales bacterium]
MPVTVTPVLYEGRQAVELLTPALRLVALYEYGPRLAFFGRPGGDNLLFWNPDLPGRGEWKLRGGHRVWVTRPLGDEGEETYRPDNQPAEFSAQPDGFALTGARDPFNGTRRGLSVRVLGDAALAVDNFVRNDNDVLYSGGVWALTCTLPRAGTRYGVPVGDGATWDAFHMVFFRTWAGHDGVLQDPQFSFVNDVLVVDPQGKENKRMLQAPRGIMAMSCPARGLTFAKRTGWERNGIYPNGTNVAFYIGPGNFMVELETMGAEVTLKPGETAHNVETWVLRDGATDLDHAEKLVDLFAGL